ncbi:hypothetical protein HDU67_003393, partial [Dinochytrium kinnereticum]
MFSAELIQHARISHPSSLTAVSGPCINASSDTKFPMASFPGWAPTTEPTSPSSTPAAASDRSEARPDMQASQASQVTSGPLDARASTGNPSRKSSAAATPPRSPSSSSISHIIKDPSPSSSPIAEAQEALRNVESLANCPDPSPDCSCRKVIDPSEPAVCGNCRGVVRPIFRVQQDLKRLMETMVELRRRLLESNSKESATWEEASQLSKRIEELKVVMDEKARALDELHAELRQMGERVIEEIEKRAELQVSKDALQDELEELTKGLFEEANMLVSTEARRGHHHELRVKNLEQELAEIRLQMQMEQL